MNRNGENPVNEDMSHDTTNNKKPASLPVTNPLQFVQIKPSKLYEKAKYQLKNDEEKKKVKTVVEDPEDWQSNLDNWKSCRRKRVEHIIDRVVEVKKMESETTERSRRKSKTFSEIMEERRHGRNHILPTLDADEGDDISSSEQPNESKKDNEETNNESSSANSLDYFDDNKVSEHNGINVMTTNFNSQIHNESNPLTEIEQVQIIPRKSIEITTKTVNIERSHNSIQFSMDLNSNHIENKLIDASKIERKNNQKNCETKLNSEIVCEERLIEAKPRKKPEVLPRRRITSTSIELTTNQLQQTEATHDSSDSVTEALDMAFDVIDNDPCESHQQRNDDKTLSTPQNHTALVIGVQEKAISDTKLSSPEKPSFPVAFPIPLIEMNKPILSPPKEKPPPPPADDSNDELDDEKFTPNPYESKYLQRNGLTNNSTRRIQSEIKNKRSSFLGFDDVSHESSDYELIQFGMNALRAPPDSHSRQTSDSTWSSDDYNRPIKSFVDHYSLENDKKLLEIGKNALINENNANEFQLNDIQLANKIDALLDEGEQLREMEDQYREDEEIWRVERELRQLETEELNRKKSIEANRLLRQRQFESMDYRRSLQDIHNNIYVNVQPELTNHAMNSRKSMPNLKDAINHSDAIKMKQLTTAMPPAKPLRAQEYAKISKYFGDYQNVDANNVFDQKSKSYEDFNVHNSVKLSHSQSQGNMLWLRTPTVNEMTVNNGVDTSHYDVPIKSQSHYVPQPHQQMQYSPIVGGDNFNRVTTQLHDDDMKALQHKRKSDPQCYNYNKHWLIQEAEQRRIDQERSIRARENDVHKRNTFGKTSDQKALPEMVIQTLTERVRNRLTEKKRYEIYDQQQIYNNITENTVLPVHIHHQPPQRRSTNDYVNTNLERLPQDFLSVSGKKKCSYCCKELGRGAAMIIESLRLFYHLDCFKCSVCRIPLGDGNTGADVRVRNHKLHCNNCFSSEDGMKFSCV